MVGLRELVMCIAHTRPEWDKDFIVSSVDILDDSSREMLRKAGASEGHSNDPEVVFCVYKQDGVYSIDIKKAIKHCYDYSDKPMD